MNVVEPIGLVKRRGDFTLGPLDLRVPRGFVTGMVRANGSGKTTTLRTLLGLIRADAGRIAMPPFVLPYWRVREAAAVYAASRPGWDQDWFHRLCRRFGPRSDKRVKELSRGVQVVRRHSSGALSKVKHRAGKRRYKVTARYLVAIVRVSSVKANGSSEVSTSPLFATACST